MAIEIRELIIRTVIVSDEHINDQSKVQKDMYNKIRKELMDQCKNLLSEGRKKTINKR